MGDTIRIATYNVELKADGPGVLLRNILRDGVKIQAVRSVIARLDADVIVLQRIDYDHDLLALNAFNAGLAEPYPHVFARRPNSGWPSGADLNGNGRTGDPQDAFGFGYFSGQGGMAILSRMPIDRARVADYSEVLWNGLTRAQLPSSDVAPNLWETAQNVMRLSSVAHWVVPVQLPDGTPLHLLTWHGSTPVFDGSEDLNGRRGGDETLFWVRYLSGDLGGISDAAVVVVGDANIDPERGEGRHDAIQSLLSHPRLQDPFADAPLTATVEWDGPGQMRVSYVLPDRRLIVTDAGVLTDMEAQVLATASRHWPVWVDIAY